ncbi:MAG: hypothetical protein J0H34_22400 [Rhizobiales bacterium]|nr:hypothetical protein [Hyphomicrobiales bacterium]
MNDDDVHSALVRWLHGVTGLTTIKAYQEGPRPELPYIMVNLTGTSEIRDWSQAVEYEQAEPDPGEDVGEVTARPPIETEWRFSVHAFGPDPTSILRPVRSAAQLAQKNEALFPALVIHDCSQVRNVPELVNEKWEPRAQMDMFLRGLTRDGFVIDVIEEAPFDINRTH